MSKAIIRIVACESGGYFVYSWVPSQTLDDVNQGTFVTFHHGNGVSIFTGLYDKVQIIRKPDKNINSQLEDQFFDGWYDWQDFNKKYMLEPEAPKPPRYCDIRMCPHQGMEYEGQCPYSYCRYELDGYIKEYSV